MRRRYFYTRVTRSTSCATGPVEIIAGVEVKTGEAASDVYADVREVLATIPESEMQAMSDQSLARLVEVLLGGRFDLDTRSYFLEIGRGAMDEYVQVFQE